MTHLDGFCDDRFLALADEFRANLGSGVDLGGSLATTLNGDVVVNLWGGFRYSERSVPWTEDTLVNVFSTVVRAGHDQLLPLNDPWVHAR